jgi:hypothetical protein
MGISKKERLAIVVSVIWPLLIMFGIEPWAPKTFLDETTSDLWSRVFGIGVLPVLVYWGYWFIKGGENK